MGFWQGWVRQKRKDRKLARMREGGMTRMCVSREGRKLDGFGNAGRDGVEPFWGGRDGDDGGGSRGAGGV